MIVFPEADELAWYLPNDSCLDFEYTKCQYLFLSNIKLSDNLPMILSYVPMCVQWRHIVRDRYILSRNAR